MPIEAVVTVSVAWLLVTVPLVAVIVVLSTETPVASPLFDMVAAPWLLDAQVNITPGIGLPVISVAVALNCRA